MSTNQAPQNYESQNVARIEWDGEGYRKQVKP